MINFKIEVYLNKKKDHNSTSVVISLTNNSKI